MSLHVQNSLPKLNCNTLWTQSGFSSVDTSPSANSSTKSSIASYGFLGATPSKESTKRMDFEHNNSENSLVSLEDPMKEAGKPIVRRVSWAKDIAKDIPKEQEEVLEKIEDAEDEVDQNTTSLETEVKTEDNERASLLNSRDAVDDTPDETDSEKTENIENRQSVEVANEETGGAVEESAPGANETEQTGEPIPSSSEDPKENNGEEVPKSEAAMRQKMIETELNRMIDQMMKSEDFEEEDEMEKESYEALMRAAKEICYTRKYYDVSSDKIIYFPSIIKTIVNMDLFEKAESYYFEEEDEFPMLYSMGLRQIAFDKMEAEGDGDADGEELDDDMMERLSMAVQLTETDLDELRESIAAAEAEDDEEEALETIEEDEAVSTSVVEEKGDSIETSAPGASETEQTGEPIPSSLQDPKENNGEEVPKSEAAMRQKMIETELNRMIDQMMKSEDFEEEDEMEKESYEALMQAAKEICYTRKYYDVSSDKIIYFPSIIKTIVNMDLFEKAESYYFEEEDEFPMLYSMGLRQIAFDKMEAEGDGDADGEELDDDMMERLSMAVQLTETDLDELRESIAAAEAEDDEAEALETIEEDEAAAAHNEQVVVVDEAPTQSEIVDADPVTVKDVETRDHAPPAASDNETRDPLVFPCFLAPPTTTLSMPFAPFQKDDEGKDTLHHEPTSAEAPVAEESAKEVLPEESEVIIGESILSKNKTDQNEAVALQDSSVVVDAESEDTQPEKNVHVEQEQTPSEVVEEVIGESIVLEGKVDEGETTSSLHYSNDSFDFTPEEFRSEKTEDIKDASSSEKEDDKNCVAFSANDKQGIYSTMSPEKTSQLDPEQMIIRKSFSDANIDNTTLEYVPIRLKCGVNVMCAPQVLSKSPLVLRCLQTDAQRLFTILPRSVHDLLRRTKIWVNASYSYGSFDDPQVLRHSTAHHSEEWLVQIAKDIPEKACGIEIYDCKYYERMRLHWNGAGLLLHEFCHLVHQFCLGLDNTKVLELYQKADSSGKYNQTPRRDWAGCEKTHDTAYALVDQKEFFSEMSVTYLSTGYRHLDKADSSILEACCPPLLLPEVFNRVLRQHGIEDPLERPEDSVCYICDYAKRRHPKPKLEIADPIFKERAIATNCRNIPICNKFYPFTRGQLKHHDPSLCDSMGDLWREIARWKDPEAESNSKCSFLGLPALFQ